jgi:hypothetical protein
MKNTFFKIIYIVLVIFNLSFIQGCKESNLTDLNKDLNSISYVIPDFSFSTAIIESNPGEQYRSLGQGLQYFSTYREVTGFGDKFFSFGGTAGTFNIYTTQINRLIRIEKSLPGPENVNKRAACEILRILAFHRQTDLMGDMPYSEAMKGLDGLSPKYDTQKSIYTAMLTELETALKSMDATKPNVFNNADLYFKGDVAKWKKFGYTLMLRLGMRLSDVDPATARIWVEKAVVGGVMMLVTDIAYLKFANGSGQMNPRTNNMLIGDYLMPGGDNTEGGKWAAKFIDHLKNTTDPRLPVLSVVWVPTGGSYTANNTPSIQRGMVNGSINTKPADFDSYSEPSLLYLDRGSPIITMGAAEAYLIIAESAARGWSVGTTAKAAYDNGVRAAMAQWVLWPTVAPHSGVITSGQVDAYLLANPYPAAGTFAQQLEAISTQKWVSLLGDDYEVYSNWRRTKYPVFNYANWTNNAGQKVPYPGNVTGGNMFRRFSLPNNERLLNPTNYFEAIKRQNFSEDQGDLLKGRMWWDVGPGTGQSN